MKQTALSMTGYFDKGKKTKREQFLAEMDRVVPWKRLCSAIEPHYPKPQERWPAADSTGAHAAYLLPAAVVQPV